MVTLYQGGSYQLYRLQALHGRAAGVCAGGGGSAFYGGDPDNFEYPRYDLDICIFRAYENGQPAHPEHYLDVERRTARRNTELVFVSGHPGSTSRQLTPGRR